MGEPVDANPNPMTRGKPLRFCAICSWGTSTVRAFERAELRSTTAGWLVGQPVCARCERRVVRDDEDAHDTGDLRGGRRAPA